MNGLNRSATALDVATAKTVALLQKLGVDKKKILL
jgi:hypothetical protein